MRSIAGFFLSLTLLLSASVLAAGDQEPGVEPELSELSLEEIDRRLNNPLADLWSLTLQNNTAINEGDAVDGSEYSNNLFFQPFMPFELGEKKSTMLTLRPVFPLVTQPVFDAGEPARSVKHTTGFGDMQILGLAGPNRGDGLTWGAGVTLKLPTAGNDLLGEGKYQAGPAAMLFFLGKPWFAGVIVQHWSSFAGDDDRADTSRTDIQYIIRRSIPGAMSVGMGPTISVDWEADSDNRLTLPVGLGLTKTVRWGGTPVKLRAEAHYSIVAPDDYGSVWNFRLQITPVIKSPFG